MGKKYDDWKDDQKIRAEQKVAAAKETEEMYRFLAASKDADVQKEANKVLPVVELHTKICRGTGEGFEQRVEEEKVA